MSKDGNGDFTKFHNASTTSGNSTVRKVFTKRREEYIPAGMGFFTKGVCRVSPVLLDKLLLTIKCFPWFSCLVVKIIMFVLHIGSRLESL